MIMMSLYATVRISTPYPGSWGEDLRVYNAYELYGYNPRVYVGAVNPR